jgi:DNA repair protein RadC
MLAKGWLGLKFKVRFFGGAPGFDFAFGEAAGYNGGGMSHGIRIKDLPQGERPRERLAALGADALRSAELIAILLRTGMKGMSAIEVAESLLQRFGTLDRLASASLDELRVVKGVGRDKAVALLAAFTLAKRMAKELRSETPLMESPESVAQLLREENRSYEVEHFQIVLLNARKRLIRVEHVSQGLVDTLLVHPREVFKSAIAANASFVVLAHNHPSGDPTPSDQDVKVTRDLARAGRLLQIEVLDHVIIGKKAHEGGRDYASLRELGFMCL